MISATHFRTNDGQLSVEIHPDGPPPDLDRLRQATAGTSTGLAAANNGVNQRAAAVNPELSEPTMAELASNVTLAAARWIAAGFPVVSQAEYEHRSAVCEACKYWDGSARFGLGKCQAPGCGCTKFKRWLATETCRHPGGSKWADLVPKK